MQWLLWCQTQVAKQATHRNVAEPDVEFLPDQLTYTPSGPQGKMKAPGFCRGIVTGYIALIQGQDTGSPWLGGMILTADLVAEMANVMQITTPRSS